MAEQPDLLRNLRVASPCHIGWESMTGDDRVRFCDSCSRHVYNFSDLTSSEIKTLIVETEGGICGRLHRRVDGTILTRDCPVGLRATRLRVARLAGAVFATLLSACSFVFSQKQGTSSVSTFGGGINIERSTSNPEQIGKFQGVVVDPNNAVIVGAEVTLRNPFEKTRKVVFTDDTGAFTFKDVKDGNYLLTVSAPGFTVFKTDFIEIKADEFASTKIRLFVSWPETTITGFVVSDPVIRAGNELLLQDKVKKLPINN